MGPRFAGRTQARRYFFSPHDREAKKAARTEDLSQAINVPAGLAKIVVVKRGASAGICRSRQEQYSLMPPTVKTLDDVGAEDSFAGEFIHQFLAVAKLEDCLSLCQRCWGLFHNERRLHGGVSRSCGTHQLYLAALDRHATELGSLPRD